MGPGKYDHRGRGKFISNPLERETIEALLHLQGYTEFIGSLRYAQFILY